MKLNKIINTALLVALFSPFTAQASRVKDIASVKGVRENQLIGYGVVVGLKGTGDSSADMSSKSMVRLFEKMGVEVTKDQFKSKNIASVIVTAKLPAFARAGTKMDVTIASVGDASSLEGGMLLVTPLRAGDQNVYAVAEGVVSLGSTVSAGSSGGGGVYPTTARVPNGAIIEREIDGTFTSKKTYILSLNHPDFTTSARLARLVNTELGGKYAAARDSGTVDVIVPFNYEGNGVELLATIENLEIAPDSKARVVLNERTGTVVIGDSVRISTVAIAHGELQIEVAEAGAKPGGKGPKEKVGIVNGTSIKDIVKGLNSLGVSAKELSAIFQSLKAAGALQAELQIM